MQRDLADIRKRGRAGEYTGGFGEPQRPVERPTTPEAPAPAQDDGFSFGDVAFSALVRGPESAIRSTYGLLDALTFDSLPDYTENFSGHSNHWTGQIAEGLSQFAVGWYSLGGAVGAVGKGLNLGRTATNVARGVATDFTVFDGQSGRLADLVAKIPGLEDPMNDYLSFALTDEQDGELIGRMKNAIEGAGVGAAIDGIIAGVKWLKATKKEQAAGKTVEEAVESANKVVHLGDVNKLFAQLDDMRFAQESPFKDDLLDDAIARAQTEPVWLNADGTDSPTMLRNQFTVDVGVQGVAVKAGARTVDIRPVVDVETDLARHFDDAADVLKRRLKFDDRAVAAYWENVRKAEDINNPERESAMEQMRGVLGRLSARDRKRLETGTPTGRTTSDLIAELKAGGSERGVREAREIGTTSRVLGADSEFYVTLSEVKFPKGTMARTDVKNWLNKWGTMLDNPQTTIRLDKNSASIGVHLSPEQAKDDAMRKALESWRCL